MISKIVKWFAKPSDDAGRLERFVALPADTLAWYVNILERHVQVDDLASKEQEVLVPQRLALEMKKLAIEHGEDAESERARGCQCRVVIVPLPNPNDPPHIPRPDPEEPDEPEGP